MDVYLNSYFGNTKGGETPAKEINADKKFEWNGRQWNIPAIYLFENGLVIDFCIMIPKADAEEYLNRWYGKCRADKLTNEEFEVIEKESPFSFSFRADACLNGEELPGLGASAVSWHPCEKGRECIGPEAEELMEHYGCSRQEGWQFVRSSYSWPESGKPPLTKAGLGTLTLTLKAHPVFYPGFHFKTEEGQPRQDLSFTHPATMEVYTLNILSCTADTLPDNSFPEDRGLIYPRNYLVLSYTVTPELSPEEFLIRDCSPCDQPYAREKAAGQSSVYSVSVIAASGGPVSIFVAGKDPEGTIAYPACSSPHFSPVTSAEWRTVFYKKECEDLTVDNILA